ncbi:MAG TPA: hypothetical protein VGM74_14105 [Burkholderiaceae bacterium]
MLMHHDPHLIDAGLAFEPGGAGPLRQLMGRHRRLTRELSAACMQPLQVGRINRLAADIAAAEHEIAALRVTEAKALEPFLQAA